MYTTLRNLKKDQICGLLTVRRKTCFPELGGGGQFYPGNLNKIEHEGISACAKIKIRQDANNADQK